MSVPSLLKEDSSATAKHQRQLASTGIDMAAVEQSRPMRGARAELMRICKKEKFCA